MVQVGFLDRSIRSKEVQAQTEVGVGEVPLALFCGQRANISGAHFMVRQEPQSYNRGKKPLGSKKVKTGQEKWVLLFPEK